MSKLRRLVRRASQCCSVLPFLTLQLPMPPAPVPFPLPEEEPLVLPGVVLEEIPEDSALYRAGLRPGDVVLRWERLPNPPANPEGVSGVIESPFDWMWLEIEQAPRGVVRLWGERDGVQLRVTVDLGAWREIVASPRWTPRCRALRGWDRTTLNRETSSAGSHSCGSCAKTPDLVVLACLELAARERHLLELSSARDALLNATGLATTRLHEALLRGLLGQVFEELQNYVAAGTAWREAGEYYEVNYPGSLIRAFAASGLGRTYWLSGDLSAALLQSERAVEIRCRCAPRSLQCARSYQQLGTVATIMGQYRAGKEHFQKALSIQEQLDPRGLELALTLNNMGNLETMLGHIPVAQELHSRAYTLRAERAPASAATADSLLNLGKLASISGSPNEAVDRYRAAGAIYRTKGDDHGLSYVLLATATDLVGFGRLEESMKAAQEALEIRERLSPGSLEVADVLNLLGVVARSRGDIQLAEEYHLKSLSIRRRLAPGSVDEAGSLLNLGNIASDRHDPVLAESYLASAIPVLRRISGTSLELAAALNSLAILRRSADDFPEARRLHLESLEIRRKNIPDSLDIANSYIGLGNVAISEGDLTAAEAAYSRALEVAKKQHSGGITFSLALNNLGSTLARRGKLQEALVILKEVLEQKNVLIPGTESEAQTLFNVAEILRSMGSRDDAGFYYRRAAEALANQLGLLGRLEKDRSTFRLTHGRYFRRAIEAEVQFGDVLAAFRSLERFLGAGLASSLAERGLLAEGSLAGKFEELRRSLEAATGRESHAASIAPGLAGDGTDNEELDELSAHRKELLSLVSSLRAQSPRLAATKFPDALDAITAGRSLDEGTLLRSFLAVEEDVFSFTLSRDRGLSVQSLSTSEKTLRQKVERFRNLLPEAHSGTALGDIKLAELRRLGKELYNLLLAPVADEIEKAERVMIVADGPLHYLPFAALTREVIGAGGTKRDQYLAEWKPFYSVLSATVFAELKKDRRDPSKPDDSSAYQLVAFGDPEFPASLRPQEPDEIADIRVRSAARRGALELERLPHTRREVEGIAALFPPERVQVFLGTEATEERAKAVGKGARILHFATHAKLDDRFPLNSSLLLSMPEGFPEDRENGLLQVWEIFERVRLDADLVVLSACESGLGEEQGGEGLIGLTRAFQYAGARTVLASLWEVRDEATAELMIRFYRHLTAGKPKDQALQAAQRELLAGPIEIPGEDGQMNRFDATAPYYWAAFQVIGDWQ